LATQNQSKTAELLRLSFIQVNRILYNSVERGLTRRNNLDSIVHLSIDEKSFKRGHDYVTVLSSPQTGAILNVSHGRKIESVRTVINETFTEVQKDKVQSVSSDMWEAYVNTTRLEFKNSKLCHDKFHLVQYLNKAVDQVRRTEVKTQEELKKSRYIWLKDVSKFTDNQKILFEEINNVNFETARAWQIKENFRDIVFGQKPDVAIQLFDNWCEHAQKSEIAPIIKIVEMFKRHRQGIINAIELNKSNGMAERLNGKIQETKTSAKGYRTFENFRAAILFYHGKLSLYPQET
jgi:transposase